MRHPPSKFDKLDLVMQGDAAYVVDSVTFWGNKYYYKLIPIANYSSIDGRHYLFINLPEDRLEPVSDDHRELINIIFDLNL